MEFFSSSRKNASATIAGKNKKFFYSDILFLEVKHVDTGATCKSLWTPIRDVRGEIRINEAIQEVGN